MPVIKYATSFKVFFHVPKSGLAFVTIFSFRLHAFISESCQLAHVHILCHIQKFLWTVCCHLNLTLDQSLISLLMESSSVRMSIYYRKQLALSPEIFADDLEMNFVELVTSLLPSKSRKLKNAKHCSIQISVIMLASILNFSEYAAKINMELLSKSFRNTFLQGKQL